MAALSGELGERNRKEYFAIFSAYKDPDSCRDFLTKPELSPPKFLFALTTGLLYEAVDNVRRDNRKNAVGWMEVLKTVLERCQRFEQYRLEEALLHFNASSGDANGKEWYYTLTKAFFKDKSLKNNEIEELGKIVGKIQGGGDVFERKCVRIRENRRNDNSVRRLITISRLFECC